LPVGQLALIKVDAEGFDELVLRGARETLERELPVLIVEAWAGGTSIRRFLAEFGYRFFTYASSLEPVIDQFPQAPNLIPIHCEKVDWTRARLLSAAPHRDDGVRVRWLGRADWESLVADSPARDTRRRYTPPNAEDGRGSRL